MRTAIKRSLHTIWHFLRHLPPRRAFWLLFFVGLVPGLFFVAEVVQHQQSKELLLDSAKVYRSVTQLKDKVEIDAVSVADLASSIEDARSIGPTFTRVSKGIIHDGEGLDVAELIYEIRSQDRHRFERDFLHGTPIHAPESKKPVGNGFAPGDNGDLSTEMCAVVSQVEPRSGHDKLIGTDLNAGDSSGVAFKLAKVTRKTVLSPPIAQPRDRFGDSGVLVLRLVHGLGIPGYPSSAIYVATLVQMPKIIASNSRNDANCEIVGISDVSEGAEHVMWASPDSSSLGSAVTVPFQIRDRMYLANGVCVHNSKIAGQVIATCSALGAVLVALLLALLGRSFALQRMVEEQHRKELQDMLADVV